MRVTTFFILICLTLFSASGCKTQEDCESPGDEDRNGYADCDDPVCGEVCLDGEPTCGNNVREDLEVCDGANLEGTDCQDVGFETGLLSCNQDCTFDVTGCRNFERCELPGDEDADGAADCADSDCTDTPACLCGNGLFDSGEQCDDGNTFSGDGCSTGCQTEPGYTCTDSPSMCSFVCGDGIVTEAEGCDDANATNGDGCSSICTIESGYSCMGSPSECTQLCGNAVVDLGEQCDDGNMIDGDGCESNCTLSLLDVCGDGTLTGFEQCDDGNTFSGDGCSTSCQVELGYTCTSSPSMCSFVCGDGIVTEAEGCDDANATNGDGCSSICTIESGYGCMGAPSVCSQTCGNGLVDPGEQCDDGNMIDGDGCESDCTATSPCPDQAGATASSFDPATGHCYYGIGELRQWQPAQADCVARGGYLAVIDSMAENMLARSAGDPASAVWIGFHDTIIESFNNPLAFADVIDGDGTSNFHNFYSNEPNGNSSENCVMFFESAVDPLAWNDVPCTAVVPYICEIALN